MPESCKRYITSRMLCFVRRTLDRVLSEYLCESGVVWVLGFVLFLYPITRESDPAPRKTAASVAPSGAGSHSNFNCYILTADDIDDRREHWYYVAKDRKITIGVPTPRISSTPAPPRGGEGGNHHAGARVFQHVAGVSAPT